MYQKIKKKLERELLRHIRNLDKSYSLSKSSSLLFKAIEDFVTRPGKRVRPLLFIISYLGFAKRPAAGLYQSALAQELLHDFLLVHDDIVDKSALRRGKLSMHGMLNQYLRRFKNVKFSGQDLAIIAGDIIYAMAINSFLSIKAGSRRKEKALRQFTTAAFYTGIGEFIELLSGVKDIAKISRQEIYKIYDYKTAYYTFAAPLSAAAILAGAGQRQSAILHRCGIYLGRAFQIRDDILGIFGEEKDTGKSPLTDLQEAKKTLPLWYAYNHCRRKDKLHIKQAFLKQKIKKADLLKIRRIISASGALDYAKRENVLLQKKAQKLISSSRLEAKYKSMLTCYCRELLQL